MNPSQLPSYMFDACGPLGSTSSSALGANANFIKPPAASGDTIRLNGISGGRCVISVAGTFKIENAPPNVEATFYSNGVAVILQNQDGSTIAGGVLAAGESVKLRAETNAKWTCRTPAAGIALLDTAGWTAQTDVEGALAQIYQHLLSIQGISVAIPLSSFRLVDANGDVGNAAANGGLLASDTAPIYLADANEAHCIQWAATVVFPIQTSTWLDADFDEAQNVLIDIYCQASGTTNAPSFTCRVNFDGGTQVSVATTGGTTSGAKQMVTSVIPAASVPAGFGVVSVQIEPGAHTPDSFSVYGVKIRCKRNLLGT